MTPMFMQILQALLGLRWAQAILMDEAGAEPGSSLFKTVGTSDGLRLVHYTVNPGDPVPNALVGASLSAELHCFGPGMVLPLLTGVRLAS